MAIPFRYSLRSVWRRRTTTLATAAGLALSVFVLASSLMLAAGVRGTLVSAGREDRALVLERGAFSEDGSGMPQSVIGLAVAAPGVRREAGRPLVSGEAVVQLPFRRPGDASENYGVQVRGVTDAAFGVRPAVRVVAGRRAKSGTGEAIVGRGLVGHYEKLGLGGSFETGKNARFSIVGVFEAEGSAYESEVWTDLDVLRDSLGWTGYVSSVTARLESPRAFGAFARTLEGDKRRGVRVERERAYYEKVSKKLFEAIVGLGALVTFIVSLGAMLGSTITMYASVGQRVTEIGVLRALGFTRAEVLVAFLVEAMALALAGAACGVGLALLTPFFDFATTNTATGQAVTFRFQPTLAALLGSTLTGTLVGLAGGFFPALNAARVSPARAVRA